MKTIRLFYTQNLPTGAALELPAAAGETHFLSWAGALNELSTGSGDSDFVKELFRPAEAEDSAQNRDSAILEAVFVAFNKERRPPRALGLRSLSPGDVVAIDDRAYHCLMVGWKRIENFVPAESKIVEIASLEDFTENIKIGAKICSIFHHLVTGWNERNEAIYGDIKNSLKVVTKIEGTKFWLKGFGAEENSLQEWFDWSEFTKYRIENNRLTVVREVGFSRGWARVGNLATGEDFDWTTFWIVE